MKKYKCPESIRNSDLNYIEMLANDIDVETKSISINITAIIQSEAGLLTDDINQFSDSLDDKIDQAINSLRHLKHIKDQIIGKFEEV